MRIHSLALILAGGVLAGCASVPMAPSNLDASAKQFTPAADQGHIYISRGGGLGTAIVYRVNLDGEPAPMGWIAQHTYLMMSVPPGEHTILIFPNFAGGGGIPVRKKELTVEDGGMYFYTISHPADGTKWNIELLNANDGRKAVMGAKLADTMSYSYVGGWSKLRKGMTGTEVSKLIGRFPMNPAMIDNGIAHGTTTTVTVWNHSLMFDGHGLESW